MRFRSTPQSRSRGEVSVLAILECLAAVGIYVAIGFWLGSFAHLAAAISLAPLFLLRTRYSTKIALILWGRAEDKGDDLINRYFGYLYIVILPLIGLIIRIFSTAYGVIKYPLESLRSIPRNWRRQALATDLFIKPEIVPGESTAAKGLKFDHLVEILDDLRNGDIELSFASLPGIILTVIVALIGYIPPIIFRISFKATSLVYIPLLWVTRIGSARFAEPEFTLGRITAGELEKSRRWLSGVILGLVAMKLALAASLVERSYVVAALKSERLADLIVGSWPWWQIAFAADAALTFVIFYVADVGLARVKEGLGGAGRVTTIAIVLMLLRSASAAAVVTVLVANVAVSLIGPA